MPVSYCSQIDKSSAYSRTFLIEYPAARQQAKPLSYPFVSLPKEVCTGARIRCVQKHFSGYSRSRQKETLETIRDA